MTSARRKGLAAVAVVVAIAGGTTVAWRLSHRGPARPSIGKAVDRFRSSSTLSGAAPPSEPRPGVYVYDGSGTEDVSFLGTHQSQGPREPGTVANRAKGCSTFRIDFNSYHSQAWTRCAAGSQLLEQGNKTDQRFDFVAFSQKEHSVATCNPPLVVADRDAKPGMQWPVHCAEHSATTGANVTQSGTTMFVGKEIVDVGGTAVPAVHTREELQLAGDQTGTVRLDIWFATSNWIPLAERHTISVKSPAPAPIHHIAYTETGTWRLASLTPHT